MIPVNKNKIVLSDYDYERDIRNRLLLAAFSQLDLEVLEEILHGSLYISKDTLAETLHLDSADLDVCLEGLIKTGLFTVNDQTLTVDKQLRKYFELEIIKFDEDFSPNISYILQLLNRIPIHILPNWYAISRTSNDILKSIIEKIFLTPQVYVRHLSELEFDDLLLSQMVSDLLQSPEQGMRADEICAKYNLSREQFVEYTLILEFHFVGYSNYHKIAGQWIEVITPFKEWVDYLHFKENTKPTAIDEKEVARKHLEDLGYVLEISEQLLAFETGESFCEAYHKKLLDLDFIDGKQITGNGKSWLEKPVEDRAIILYRHPLNTFSHDGFEVPDRMMREIEKSIRRVKDLGFVLFEDFMNGFTESLDALESVVLEKMNSRKWHYKIPTYTPEETRMILRFIEERLYEVGIIATGTFQGKPCFSVTPFGKSIL